jgi:deferrochelatase/peroxidase EfeB
MEQSLITIAIPIRDDADKGRQRKIERCLEPFGNLHRHPVPQDEASYVQAKDTLRGGLPADGVQASLLQWRLKATDIVHFMSMNVVPGTRKSPAHLLVEISADGPPTVALNRLSTILAEEIPDLWETLGILGQEALERAFMEHMLDVGPDWGRTLGLPFIGAPGMTVTRINAEARLACTILADLLHEPMKQAASPLKVLESVRRKLWANGEKWAFFPEPIAWQTFKPSGTLWAGISSGLGFLWPLLAAAIFISALVQMAFGWSAALWTLGGLMLIGLPGLAAALAIWLRRAENEDNPPLASLDRGKIEAVMQQESHCATNHLFAVSRLKSAAFRPLTLRLAFLVIARMARFKYGPGALGDLKTIHFARWVLIPGTDQLVFLSNYSGSWESYLEDFITKAHQGLTGVWSNTRGFPKTRNLFQDGATDGDRFKRWARSQQEPSRLWFCAYPDLTTARIRLNALIRQGIASATTESEAADWLSCFGSAPRPASALEAGDVPSLVFGGLSPFRYGAALIVRLKKESAGQWLDSVKDNVIHGDVLPQGDREALVLAFSAAGLAKIGLSKRDISTFPVAFQDGMDASWRARNLGDIGRNDPKEWVWGNEPAVDAILLLYAKEEHIFDAALRQREGDLSRLAHQVVQTIVFTPLSKDNKADQNEQERSGSHLEQRSVTTSTRPPTPVGQVEAFGFIDGVSQPIIRGTRRWTAERDRNHLVQPGEIVLGYPDNRNKVPPSPSVLSTDDPDNLLPSLAGNVDGSRPDFSRPQPTAERDFGRGGTFLVVRQLEQDTAAFRDFVSRTAENLEGDPRAPKKLEDRREWIMAKLVGRWPDGTSLVRYPHEPGTKRHPSTRPDNDFLFANDDPDGLRCPFGAHVRRTNPRDSLGSGDTAEQLAISNRHRILRVGRRYGSQGKFEKEGLFFMCLNADIERQFEFVQQTWTNATSFHGLENEVDCFSPAGRTNRFTIPTARGPLCLPRMADFVTVKGGGYFFLPGRRALRFLASKHNQDAAAARASV